MNWKENFTLKGKQAFYPYKYNYIHYNTSLEL